MMQSSGTSEGLRGLIDTSLVKSVKRIIDNRGLFGPSVLPIGMPFTLVVLIKTKSCLSYQCDGYLRT